MIKNLISDYVHTMFNESRDGELTAGDVDNQFDYPVDWDAQTAEALASKCSNLVSIFAVLAGQYDKLKNETRHLTKEQMEVWDTYLKPFPGHGLDMEALITIWEKSKAGEYVSEEEWSLADQWMDWFETNALTRLPVKQCHPTQVINRAKRYCKAVRLNAPEVVRVNEAKRFAEEFVLYHCMKQD